MRIGVNVPIQSMCMCAGICMGMRPCNYYCQLLTSSLISYCLHIHNYYAINCQLVIIHYKCTYMHQHLSPSPRASIQTAMSDPSFYLPSAGSVGDQTSLDSNMPDLCIAYQLHLECGRHINLYDWLTVQYHYNTSVKRHYYAHGAMIHIYNYTTGWILIA